MAQTTDRRQCVLYPPGGTAESLAHDLARLIDTRQRTLEWIETINPAVIDWQPPDHALNSISTVLYHLAAIDAYWLYMGIRCQEFPPEAAHLFPHDVRDQHGYLTVVRGLTLQEHVEYMAEIRALVMGELYDMDPADYRRPRAMPDFDVTPEWTVHHLNQHEAEHRGEMKMVYTLASLYRR